MEAGKKRSSRQWNRISDQQRQLIVDLALDNTGLSSRELVVKITDEQQIFVSESSVYRILKGIGLIPPAAHRFILATDNFHTKTKFPNDNVTNGFYLFTHQRLGMVFLIDHIE